MFNSFLKNVMNSDFCVMNILLHIILVFVILNNQICFPLTLDINTKKFVECDGKK